MAKRILMFLILMFSLFTVYTDLHAATYFVDPEYGSDGNQGTSTGQAWKTIPGSYLPDNSGFINGSGWQRLNAGDIVYIKSGTTVTNKLLIDQTWYNNGTLSNPIQILRSPGWGTGGQVVFDGISQLLNDWDAMIVIFKRDYIQIDGNGTVLDAYGRSVPGIQIQRSLKQGLVATTNQNDPNKMIGLVLRDLKLFSNAWFNVVLQGQDTFSLDNVEVDGDKVDDPDNRSGGIKVGGSGYECNNGTLKNCKSYNNGSDPGTQEGYTNARIGFWLTNSTRITYENCEAYDNEGDGFDTGVDGSNPVVSDEIKFINCLSYNNFDGFGANLDNVTGGGRYYYVNCISRNNKNGWNIYNGPDAYIYNSVSANNLNGVYVDAPSTYRDTKITMRNTVLHGNTANAFYPYRVDRLVLSGLNYNLYDRGTGSDVFVEWNDYYVHPASKRYTYSGVCMPGYEYPRDYSNPCDIVGWRADHGQDQNSLVSTGPISLILLTGTSP